MLQIISKIKSYCTGVNSSMELFFFKLDITEIMSFICVNLNLSMNILCHYDGF